MKKTVLIVVTHLLGAGHLSRALTLARAFAARGHDAHVSSGGLSAPQLSNAGVTLHQLPPVRIAGTDFTRLLREDGTEADDIYKSDRISQALSILETVAPDILITELFPFGRRNLRAEFTALLEAAKSSIRPPAIYTSIRDILAPPSKPAKAQFAEDMVEQYYDAVLVHSDPKVVTLDHSWPSSAVLDAKLHYTGYIAPLFEHTSPDVLSKEIIVSAGGGAVGRPLFQAALEAAHWDDRQWRLLVGGQAASVLVSELSRSAGSNVSVEPARPDFRALLSRAEVSVNMCGYNTVMDVLQTGIPSVMVPFDAGGEVEQTLRAARLDYLPGVEIIKSNALTGRTLSEAIARVTASGKRRTNSFDMNGADNTVDFCIGALP